MELDVPARDSTDTDAASSSRSGSAGSPGFPGSAVTPVIPVPALTPGSAETQPAVVCDEVKAKIKAFWSKGNWGAIAPTLDPAAKQLVAATGVSPGEKVLEVAAGNGNGAVWAARARGLVVATDLCPAMVKEGRVRSEREGLDIEWREADMEDLPFADSSFDCVLSAFGIIFVMRPEAALHELFRVAKPGGRVGLVNWTPQGWAQRLSAITGKYGHRARGDSMADAVEAASKENQNGRVAGRTRWTGLRPMDWGDAAKVKEILKGFAVTVRTEPGVVWEDFASPEAWWASWTRDSPPGVAASAALAPDQHGSLRRELIQAIREANVLNGERVRWPSQYLITVAEKPA